MEYVIKQKPKPRPTYETQVGVDVARLWCHDNYPQVPFDLENEFWKAYLKNCYPSLCPYLSKHPDNNPSPSNDTGVEAFHNPWDPTSYAHGLLVKYNQFGSTIGNDPSDTWTVDLKVPCFKGQCAQDWASFVRAANPSANPEDYKLPQQLEHEVFGCDLWIEVTGIFLTGEPAPSPTLVQ